MAANHILNGVEGFIKKAGEIYAVDESAITIVEGWNDRRDFSGEDDLVNLIKESGVPGVLVVRKTKDKTLELIDGERRLRSIRRLKAEGINIPVPVVVESIKSNELDLYFRSITANNGKPLTPTEEANSYKRLTNVYKLSIEEIAKRVGRSVSHIRNRLELAGGSNEIMDAVDKGEISIKAAQEIVRESDGKFDNQAEALEKKKAEPSARKGPKPLTMFIKSGEVRQKGGRKEDECRPLVEFFTSKELRDKIRDAGFDPDTIMVSVKRVVPDVE